MIPGVQILFAFLLTVPFAARFDGVTAVRKNVSFGTLRLTALTTGFLIAPSAHHRVLRRQNPCEERLQAVSRLALAGLGCLLLAMAGTIFMVSDVIFGSTVAAVAGSGIALLFVYPWFAQPLIGVDGVE